MTQPGRISTNSLIGKIDRAQRGRIVRSRHLGFGEAARHQGIRSGPPEAPRCGAKNGWHGVPNSTDDVRQPRAHPASAAHPQ